MATQPNILLIMTDQQRYDSLGCYGFEAGHTPNLDALAAEGAVFERCYINNPICTPSRASLMTGQHLPGHGVYKLYDVLPDDQVLFTEHLRRVGYHTALFGKLHVSSTHYEAEQRHPNDGFDVYEWCLEGPLRMDSPFHGYRKWLEQVDPAFCGRLRREGRAVLHIPQHLHMTHWAAERTIDYVRARSDAEQPFFCMMSVFDPHNPYEDHPLEMRDLIDANAMPDPLIVEGELEGKPAALRRESGASYLGDFANFSLDDLREMRLGYHASIALVDQEVGRVLNALEDAGIAENTLVIFTSDHGDMLGDHQLLVKGAFFFDPNVRVPLLMRWPARFEGNHRVRSLVQPHDLAATILSAAGLPPEDLAQIMPESRSLLKLASGEVDPIRDYAVCCYRNSGLTYGHGYWDPPIHATMFRDERYKVNVYHAPGFGAGPIEGELYDMVEDPAEIYNLWDDAGMAAVRQTLIERLADWLGGQERRLGARGGERLPTLAQQMPNAIK